MGAKMKKSISLLKNERGICVMSRARRKEAGLTSNQSKTKPHMDPNIDAQITCRYLKIM
jgi:hypothetical protein